MCQFMKKSDFVFVTDQGCSGLKARDLNIKTPVFTVPTHCNSCFKNYLFTQGTKSQRF